MSIVPPPEPGSAPAPSQPTTMPSIPGVRLESVIGRGGFATVYGGVQDSIQRPVAVKVDSRPLDDERNKRRYLREVQAAGRISGHPHVVSLVDTGVLCDGRPYIVMERCDGGSLETLAAEGPIPVADAVRLVLAASSALGAAHAAGILHRDVKPANILLDSYGSPRLTDFGIAAVVREGQDPTVTLECLTPDFAPPEAFEMQPPGPSGDVWSMGATLFYLLTGRGPRRGPDGKTLSLPEIVRQLNTPVDLSAATIPTSMRPLLAKAMHRDPAQRYPNGTALSEALAAAAEALGDGGITVSGPGVAVRLAQASMTPPACQAGTALAVASSAGQAPAYQPVSLTPEAPRPRRKAPLLVAGAVGLATGLALGAGGAAVWLPRSLTPPQAGAAQPSAVASSVPAQAPTPEAAATQEPAQGAQPSPASSLPGQPPAPSLAAPQPGPAKTSLETPESFTKGVPPYDAGTCLNGLVVISDVPSTSATDCTDSHHWEVFATGTLTDQTKGFTLTDLKSDANVIATCTREKAIAYGEPNPEVEVIGPSEAQWLVLGVRSFSCLVGPAGGGGRTGSYSKG